MKRTYQREWAYKKRRAAAASASFTAVDEQDDQDDQGQCDQDQNDQIDLLDPNDISEENDFLDQNEQDNQDPDEILELEEDGDLFYDCYQETEMFNNNYDIYSNVMDIESDSDDDEIIEQEPDLAADLRAWASSEQVTMKSCDSLLKILKPFHPQLPKTARTLLHTKKNIVITNQSSMEVYRYNVENSLKSHLGR